MAAKLPWFPFYVNRWMTNDDVLELTGDQMAAYLWLLCLQWQHGALPYESHRVVPMVPRNIPDRAVTYALLKFFPADPDTNERRNPTLAEVRDQQLATYEVRVEAMSRARKSKQDKHLVNQLPNQLPNHQDKKEKEIENKKEVVVGVPETVLTAAESYLREPKTRTARLGYLRSLLQGMTDRPVPEAVMIRAVTDMAVSGAEFRPVVLKRFCDRAAKLVSEEQGRHHSTAISPDDAAQPLDEADLGE